MINENLIPKMIELKVLFVRTADDDGYHYSWDAKNEAEAALAYANGVYKPLGIRFTLDPSSNFYEYPSPTKGIVKDTQMNHECPAFANTPEDTVKSKLKSITEKDVNKDGQFDKYDAWFLCDRGFMAAKRTAYALQFPDKIVVFVNGGNRAEAFYDKKLGHWDWNPSGYRAYSSGNTYWISMYPNFQNTLFAHEVGHYLHLNHTFYSVKTVDAAKEEIKNYILKHEKESEFNPQAEGLNVFNADGLSDTPPDAAGKIFESLYGDKCLLEKGTVPLDVSAGSKTYHFTLAPDRGNVMSYFGCFLPEHLSSQQKKIVKKALFEGNRQPLVRPELVSCYKKKGIDQGLLLGKQRKEQTVSGVEKIMKKRLGIIESCLNGSKNPYLNVDVKNPPKVTLPLNQLPRPDEMD